MGLILPSRVYSVDFRRRKCGLFAAFNARSTIAFPACLLAARINLQISLSSVLIVTRPTWLAIIPQPKFLLACIKRIEYLSKLTRESKHEMFLCDLLKCLKSGSIPAVAIIIGYFMSDFINQSLKNLLVNYEWIGACIRSLLVIFNFSFSERSIVSRCWFCVAYLTYFSASDPSWIGHTGTVTSEVLPFSLHGLGLVITVSVTPTSQIIESMILYRSLLI